jgi:putative transposase
MPRIARGLADNQIYHVINRGNRRETIFHDSYDYDKFLKLIKEAKDLYQIKIYAYCLMPNHYHLVIYTKVAESLSLSMHKINSSYVRYYNQRYKVSGHLWQGRYKSFIVQEEAYLLTLLRYVEANPLRAKIVKDCIAYKYSSAKIRIEEIEDSILDGSPINLPENWNEYINNKESKSNLGAIKNSLDRQAPLGDENWCYRVSKKYGLESTITPRGRPMKKENI